VILSLCLLDMSDDEWIYQLIYAGKIQPPVSVSLPFEEMSPLERSRFISEALAPALLEEQFEVLDARPKEVAEKYLGESLDDDDDDEDVDIIDLLNKIDSNQQNLIERIEDIEIRLNGKGKNTK